MDYSEMNLEQMVEEELIEHPEEQPLIPTDQYGINIEGQMYGDQEGLLEIERSIEAVSEPPQMDDPDHLLIRPVENDQEIVAVLDDSPEIVRYLKKP